jgi:NAD(P)-dependent dehydrogenase (short-subunit alcohol dehydrogenase family)
VCCTWASPGSRELVDTLCGEIRSTGGTATSLNLNLTDPVSSSHAVAEFIDGEGASVDIVVHNAAVRPRRRLLEVTLEEWHMVMDTNLTAPFFINQRLIPHMRSVGWGRIIHIGGLDAYWGTLQRPHVVASKSGVIGLVRAQANEVARWGITVNAVIPGVIDTTREVLDWYPDVASGFAERKTVIPMGKLGQPIDVANACAFLASDQAGYITGQELFVTGGAHPLVRQPSREYDD